MTSRNIRWLYPWWGRPENMLLGSYGKESLEYGGIISGSAADSSGGACMRLLDRAGA